MTDPLWWDGAADQVAPAPEPLPSHVDVAIVGGGFTGLWTAYYLLRERPELSVLVLEAEHIGFGASGRNGGWVSALFPVGAERLAARHGRSAALAMLQALRDTVDEVGSVLSGEGVDAGFVKGGSLILARGDAQAERARAAVEADATWGGGARWLSRAETLERFAVADAPGRAVRGATLDPHCARVHPRRLVDGLAGLVRARGGMIAERSAVTGLRRTTRDRHLVTVGGRGSLTAGTMIRATEGYTASLPRVHRRLAPVYSLMVATEPLSTAQWEQIGLREREVFADHGHVVIYGQRTVDDRIAFGGRGAPYHFGSRISPAFDHDEAVFSSLRRTLTDLLPDAELNFTHAWGGPLGIPRDWHPSVGFEADARVGWAGGYVGDGVAATNLAGRTLADLVLGRRTGLTGLPWVQHRSPSWEIEPLRWLGVNAGLQLAGLADREERATGRPARSAALLDRLTGH
ncbi:FAD-dependent oxidoreductase [Marihabitans asiaticum]|uniref:Glycine/D-amino acid oxidase-like deaminating enzyme n=1 Tax=Marihabitans asiaticum TaxID=415218 RepID=A0A560W9Y3_9MICO|nr:FAD-dependent oxidoreductase [Marihabitans asiaticum]TWD14360.1 glycine/D-amino acid oxidase-like deaminating enzyme [Marihabitans asiaticum]